MPRRRRPWTALLAAILLLVPLALSGHAHAGHAGAECAVCVVSHHTPTVRTDAPAVAAPIVVPSPFVTCAPVAPSSADRPVHAGRGPPALLATHPS